MFFKIWKQEGDTFHCTPVNTSDDFKVKVCPPNMENNICTYHLEVIENNTNYSDKEIEQLTDSLIQKYRNQ